MTSPGAIPRGLGRSYGDAAQLAGGTVIDVTRLAGLHLDSDRGIVVAGGGTSLGEVLDLAVPHGWFLPVTPGTRHVTVGGAIASDVHGKNHHRDGSFGKHIESLQLVTGDGRMIEVGAGDNAFSATLGGMGLTGIITRATFRLIPIETPWMSVNTRRAHDMDAVMDALSETDANYRYSVAWVDLTTRGRGRGIVMNGDHARASEIDDLSRPRRNGPGILDVPAQTPCLVNDLSVSVFNRAWYSMAPRTETGKITSIGSFFYPLDGIENWNHLYGPQGFLQYQFVIPHGEERTLANISEKLARSSTPVALAVLKRMGSRSVGSMSFPIPGWTLAVDLPLGNADLAATLDDCDAMVAAADGRVYLAKDARLRPEMFRDMYPSLSRWQTARERLDPKSVLRSSLSDRLQVTG